MPRPKNPERPVDVLGVGINATDTVIQLPRFPQFNSKLELASATAFPGGQIASALMACRRWDLSARYIGSIGDDLAGELQGGELKKAAIESRFIQIKNCLSQLSFILVDQRSGERTILWKRDSRLTLKPAHIRRDWVMNARALLVDGHDALAAAQAARWARIAQIPVVADVDNVYPGLPSLLRNTDYLFASREFPSRIGIKKMNLLASLPIISRRYRCKVTGVTLGHLGALAWDSSQFHYCRGFRVRAVDTTGAGDIFHAGIVYGILQKWPLKETLEFSCAAAALNCTQLGARGGIKSIREIRNFMRHAKRSPAEFSAKELEHAAAHFRKG